MSCGQLCNVSQNEIRALEPLKTRKVLQKPTSSFYFENLKGLSGAELSYGQLCNVSQNEIPALKSLKTRKTIQ
jgi:hypothetical protein